MPSTARLLECAVEAAKAAGQHALRNHRRRREVLRNFRHDVKLNLDVECQDRAEATIRRQFPKHSFLGEEGLADRNGAALEWVIDPIDGTVNFSHGLPMWCSSVAVRQGEQVLAGAVYAPMLDELYTAAIDRLARCNGRRLHVSDVSTLKRAMICTGLEKSRNPFAPPFQMLQRLHSGVQKCRVMGSAALDLCRVAQGHTDGYFESGIFLWDVAAAGLIVERAGGRADILRQKPDHRYCYVATNGLIHRALCRLLEPVL